MKRIVLFLYFMFITLLCACGEKETNVTPSIATPIPTRTPTETVSPTLTPTIIPSPTEAPTPSAEDFIPEGMVKSRLTGLWIPEESADYRPCAIMINNINMASPQSGLSAADILYEALVEYGITRFMAIFDAQDAFADTTSRIGSIRSARHYYIDFANEYDAIFIHYGATVYANDKINNEHTDEIDGITSPIASHAFTRDTTINAPHNVFLDYSMLLSAIMNSTIRSKYREGTEAFFSFYDNDTVPNGGTTANKITISFSQSVKPYFIYDATNREYTRYQFGTLHKDANNDQPLSFKNLIVQYVDQHNIDKNGYQTMELADTEGEGYYFTNGTVIPIRWSKNIKNQERHFYDASGQELQINVGKTYVALYPDSYRGGVTFE